MDNRGRGCRDSGHGNNHLLSASDQQAFMEAISVAIATNAQASAMLIQEGQVTSRDSKHIILIPLGEEGTR